MAAPRPPSRGGELDLADQPIQQRNAIADFRAGVLNLVQRGDAAPRSIMPGVDDRAIDTGPLFVGAGCALGVLGILDAHGVLAGHDKARRIGEPVVVVAPHACVLAGDRE